MAFKIALFASSVLLPLTAANCPASYQTSFVDIDHTQDGAYFNLPQCAKSVIDNVEYSVGCDNANCLVGQAAQALTFIANEVEKNCTNNCPAYTAATDLFLKFVSSVASDCSTTVAPVPSPTNSACITSDVAVASTSSLTSGTILLPTSTTSLAATGSITSAAPTQSPPSPVNGWTKAQAIGAGIGTAVGLAVSAGGLFTYIRRQQKKRAEKAKNIDAEGQAMNGIPKIPSHDIGRDSAQSHDEDSNVNTRPQE